MIKTFSKEDIEKHRLTITFSLKIPLTSAAKRFIIEEVEAIFQSDRGDENDIIFSADLSIPFEDYSKTFFDEVNDIEKQLFKAIQKSIEKEL